VTGGLGRPLTVAALSELFTVDLDPVLEKYPK
jgi:hypothetical protein